VAGLGEEVSVLVNGVAALVKDGRFIANYVPTDSIITAELIEDDNTSSESTITYRRSTVYVVLTADTDFGVVPLEVTFNAEVSDYFSLSSANLDCGQSGVEIQHGSLTEFTATFSQPGIYLCTLTATNTGGQTRQNSLGILVQTPEALDSLLQAKWAGMKEALYYYDIEGAVSFFAENSRASYHQQFTALSLSLPQIAADMEPITLLSVGKNSAIYDLRTIRNGTEYSFQLMFVRDGDGIWRIRNF
jgi:hypothetical protein